MNSFSETFNIYTDKGLSWVHSNKYSVSTISLFLAIYAALVRPTLPSYVRKLFMNPVFRLVVIAYIIYRTNENPQVAVMIALAFLVTMHLVNRQEVEGFAKIVDKISSMSQTNCRKYYNEYYNCTNKCKDIDCVKNCAKRNK